MKNTGPLETKVAAGSGASLLVGVIFGLAHFYHWFTPPPTYVSLGLATLVTLAAGWLAPHTSRLKPLTKAQADLLDQTAALSRPVATTYPSGQGPTATTGGTP